MTEKQKKVMDCFKENGEMSPHKAAVKLGYSESAHISYPIKVLTRRNKLKKIGSGRHVKYSPIK